MKVSVCCMTFNHKDFIKQCLESILMQKTKFNFDVIIHDDASTDGTQEIIMEYESKYPFLFFSMLQSENQYSKAKVYPWLFLYPLAGGKYIAECDGDDFWTDPYKLQKQVDFMEANPDYSICYHPYLMLTNGVFSEPSAEPPCDYTADELIAFDNKNGYGMATNTKLYRNFINDENIKYFDNLCPDYILNVIAGMHGKCKFIEGIEPSVYRKHPGNTWSGTSNTFGRAREMKRRLYQHILESGNDRYIQLRKGII